MKDIIQFLLARKKYWLLPVILILIIIGTLLVFTAGSALSPFIYPLF